MRTAATTRRWTLVVITLLACATASSALGRDRSEPSVPAWRGEHPGTAWLGADMLWRTREWLIFHMQDETGGGFNLDLSVRDQNIYMQGERPAVVFVIGPQDELLATATVARRWGHSR